MFPLLSKAMQKLGIFMALLPISFVDGARTAATGMLCVVKSDHMYISLRYAAHDGSRWKHYVLFSVRKTEDVSESESTTHDVRFDVLIAVTVYIVLRRVTPCSLTVPTF
jgi:hypothetical protein